MKYYLIVGEASGDLHAAHLMRSLKDKDSEAKFRFFGGDLMKAVGGTCVKHYRELAYMGFVPVLLHLRTIFKNMALCKNDIFAWQPDVVILVDYAGFNLKIAKFVHTHTHIPVYYYISPKLWAWKEYRIKSIKRYVDEMFCILPFEVDFYEKKHNYKVHYVGNPTADEVREFKTTYSADIYINDNTVDLCLSGIANEVKQFDSSQQNFINNGLFHSARNDKKRYEEFCLQWHLDTDKPIIALLAGSRRQEIKDNLPAMIEAASCFSEFQMVLAGAPGILADYYSEFISGKNVVLINNDTYSLLANANAALVTSGTATLETALFGVPQVVCYKTPMPKLIRFAFKHFIKVKYISLVNLIADKEVVSELFADKFCVENITVELGKILLKNDLCGTVIANEMKQPDHSQQNTVFPGRLRSARNNEPLLPKEAEHVTPRLLMLSDYNLVSSKLSDTIAPDNAAQTMIDLLKKQ